MGIQDINKTLGDVVKEICTVFNQMGYNMGEYGFKTAVPISIYKGHKVAFDISIILNAKMSTASNDILGKITNLVGEYDYDYLQELTFKAILSFFSQIMAEGITPIIVFDGKTHPSKKNTTKARGKSKAERYAYVEQLKALYISTNPFDRTDTLINELKASMKDLYTIRREDKDALWNLFESLGIKCLRAEYDAEKLCASLSQEGIVTAVYGNDTDNYPLGTKIWEPFCSG